MSTESELDQQVREAHCACDEYSVIGKAPNNHTYDCNTVQDEVLALITRQVEETEVRAAARMEALTKYNRSDPQSVRVAEFYGKRAVSKGPIAQARFDGYQLGVLDAIAALTNPTPADTLTKTEN